MLGSPFHKKNYYQLLDLAPGASTYEVRQAYKEALEIYHEDSLVSYSLFTPQERQEIRAQIDEAFSTLMDEGKRAEYDRLLKAQGEPCRDSQTPALCATPKAVLGPATPRGSAKVMAILDDELKARTRISPAVHALMAKDVVTGADLKRVREELALSLEQIAEQTRIRLHFLHSLEEDEYESFHSRYHLKSFLKTYIRALQMDAESVANRYLKRLEGKK